MWMKCLRTDSKDKEYPAVGGQMKLLSLKLMVLTWNLDVCSIGLVHLEFEVRHSHVDLCLHRPKAHLRSGWPCQDMYHPTKQRLTSELMELCMCLRQVVDYTLLYLWTASDCSYPKSPLIGLLRRVLQMVRPVGRKETQLLFAFELACFDSEAMTVHSCTQSKVVLETWDILGPYINISKIKGENVPTFTPRMVGRGGTTTGLLAIMQIQALAVRSITVWHKVCCITR